MATTTTASSIVSPDSDYLATSSSTSKSTDNDLGKDAFIQLLVTQMQYQDPLNPMDNTEMIAQLAQFTALEQMMNVAKSSDRQLANNMIGKYVEYLYTDESTNQSSYCVGKVDYATITGDTPVLGIGDVEVSLDKVTQVYDNDTIQTSTSAFDVIGKTVQAAYTETTSTGQKETSVIEGEVKGIQMKDGKPYVLIGEEGDTQLCIAYESVQNIVENTSVTGRHVTATIKNADGEDVIVQGTVQYVKVTSNGTYLYVNDQLINFDDVEKFI